MQRVHAFDPKATASIDLESFVAADHFLRRVDRVLDLSFVRELTAPQYSEGLGEWALPLTILSAKRDLARLGADRSR